MSDAGGDPQGESRAVDRGVARRQAFLAHARDVFLEFGYEAASVNEVVRRAGGSLATLYTQFGNKEGLFMAVAEDQHDTFFRDVFVEVSPDMPLEEGLNKIGEQFLKTLFLPRHIGFYRIIVGEGRKFPQLLNRYMAAGAARVGQAAAEYLGARAAKGDPIADPEDAATFFFDTLRGRYHYRHLADPSFSMTPEELRAHVANAVRFFLNGALKR